jgi:hypothetical protein
MYCVYDYLHVLNSWLWICVRVCKFEHVASVNLIIASGTYDKFVHDYF